MINELAAHTTTPTATEMDQMHALYRQGGDRQRAPHIVYVEAACPHPGCGFKMQAIDFRLEEPSNFQSSPMIGMSLR